MISRSELQDQVELVGPKTRREIAERLAAATLFVLPCRETADGDMDNLPTVIMEAMAAGLPVVSTTLAGIPEMVQSDVNGELVAQNDSPALANAIESFLCDPARAREFGARGRELAEAKFSIETNVHQLAAILQRQTLLH